MSQLLTFLSMLQKHQAQVEGGWFSDWYTIWNGRGWLNPRRLSSSAAQEWQLDQFEAMGHHQPLGNIQLWKWTGKSWTRAG